MLIMGEIHANTPWSPIYIVSMRSLCLCHFSLINLVYVHYFFSKAAHRHPNNMILSASVLTDDNNGSVVTMKSH